MVAAEHTEQTAQATSTPPAPAALAPAPFDCQRCGACCVMYRVSFHWAEADDADGGTVPVALTEPVGFHHRCMRGTSARPVRCVALVGEVGQQVGCSIYPLRSSTCKSLQAGDEQCIKARRHLGIEPGASSL